MASTDLEPLHEILGTSRIVALAQLRKNKELRAVAVKAERGELLFRRADVQRILGQAARPSTASEAPIANMKEPVESRKCVNCGKPTANPRYCGRSCAASSSNQSSPKRSPEGNCIDCGAAIPKKQKVCPACRLARAEAIRRRDAGVVEVQTLDGRTEDVSVPRRISVHPQLVFSIYRHDKLGKEATCGQFIRQLIGIVTSGPEYLRPIDRNRHASLLADFLKFEVQLGMDPRPKPMDSLAIDSLAHALLHWVNSSVGRDIHPLFSSYAVETARLVEIHALGGYGESGSRTWRIDSLLSDEVLDKFEYRTIWQMVLDPQLKKSITGEIGGLYCIVSVPKGHAVSIHKRELFRGERSVLFRISRCHLSSNFYEYSNFSISPPLSAEREYDFGHQFEFSGELIVDERGEPIQPLLRDGFFDDNSLMNTRTFSGYFPAVWITTALVWQPDSRQLLSVPIPSWATTNLP